MMFATCLIAYKIYLPLLEKYNIGYTTEFKGSFKLNKKLSDAHKTYLEAFANSRRMKRDYNIVKDMRDPIREAVGLPVGEQGEYFVGNQENCGQESDKSVTDYNNSGDQPGLWCQWVPSEDGNYIEWDGNEKFYYYIEWIEYLIKHFFSPWGYVLSGVVNYSGEDDDDYGSITIKDNVVFDKTYRGV